MIRLQKITVVLGRTIAIDSLDMELHPGVTGLFGPNGSGKSTLLRVLSGLIKPTGGTATVEGAPLSSANEGFRRRVGYAGHEPGLYPRLTLIENLELFARLYGVDEQRAVLVLEQVGLGDRSDTLVGALSAGLKRRAAVARALLHEPQILLLDEPYANLDDDAAELVSGAVQLWRAPGRLAVIATHGAKRVKGFADASAILKRGRLISYRTRVADGQEGNLIRPKRWIR